MNFTTNDISSTPIPGAGFGPDAIVEHTPISKLAERSLDAQKSLGSSLHEDMADPIDIFSKKIDPLAEFKPQRFDPEATGFDRYKESPYFQELGFNPSLQGIEEKGSYYSGNELRYQQAQTWGDVMKNAMGQFGGLAWSSFKNTAKSDANFISALFTPDSWSSMRNFAKNIEGTPEELLEQDKEMKNIMNKYAIYSSPETDNSVLNKETFGNIVGQLGFTVGTAPYVVAEMYLLNGLTRGISTFAAGRELAQIGKLMESLGTVGKGAQAETIAANALKTGEYKKALSELTALGDIGKSRKTMESIFTGMKNLVPGYEAVNDIRMANKAGATFGQAIGAGLPGLIKNYTMFNAARAEASMEAAGTYGQMYMGLMDKYEKMHGEPATGKDLEYIKDLAYGAATDNFIVNTGILMTANSIEFGNILSKFKPAKRLMREAAENATSDEAKRMFTISGTAKRAIGETKAGQFGTKVYEKGRFGALSKLNTIRKDFGLGTALHEGAKSWGRGAAKFEISEGIQEILQETSNETLNKYYTDLYDANKSITGSSLADINSEKWKEGLGEQMNMQGWKTFLMGATTGLFLSPISGALMYGREKAVGMANKEYADMMKKRSATVAENVAISNQWYGNAFNNLREHIAGFKTSSHAAKQMMAALGEDDAYLFFNSQDDTFTKAAAVAFKTGNGEHFVNSIRALGDGRMTDQEFRDAFGIPDTGTGKPFNAKMYVNEIADKVERYYATISNVKDKFADRIMPVLQSDPYSAYRNNIQKKAFDEAAELIATMSYHADSVATRASSLKQKVSQIPGIGQASSRAFELFGNPYEISETIKVQQAKIDSYKGVDTSDVKQLTKEAQEVIDVLNAWTQVYATYQKMRGASEEEYTKEGFTKAFTETEESLMKTFKLYLDINNRENGRSSTVDMENVREAFKSLGDYIKLNEDFGQYTQAINTVTDPTNFNALHGKIAQGISTGLAANSIKHEEEIKARAEATTEPDEETEDEIEAEDETGTETEITAKSVAQKIYEGKEELTEEETDFLIENENDVAELLSRMKEAEAQLGAEEGVEDTEGEEKPPVAEAFTLSKEMEKIQINLARYYSNLSSKLSTESKEFLDKNPELKDKLEKKRVELRLEEQSNEEKRERGETPNDINTYINTIHKPALMTMIASYMEQLEKKGEAEAETKPEAETVTEEEATPTTGTEEVDVIKAQRIELEFAIKQLEDAFQARVDNLVANGATEQDAKNIAEKETPQDDKDALVSLKEKLATLSKEEQVGTTEEVPEEVATELTSTDSPVVDVVERTGRFPLNDLLRLGRTYLPADKQAVATEELRTIPVFNSNQIDPASIELRIVRNVYELREVEGGYQIFHAILDEPRGNVFTTIEQGTTALNEKAQAIYLSKGLAKGYPLRRDEFQIAIYKNNVLVGYIPNPRLFDDVLSQVTSADEFVKVVDPGKKAKEVAFAEWTGMRAQIEQMQRLIDSVMDPETDSVVIPGEMLDKTLDFYRKAEFDKQNAPDQVVNRPTLTQMEKEGVKVVQIRKPDNINYVVEMDTINPGEVVPVIANSFKSQYVALVRKDGQLFWVEILPSVTSDQQFNDYLSKGYDLLQQVSTGEKTPSEVYNEVKELFSSFISADRNSVLRFVDIEVGVFDGNSKIKVSLKINPETLKAYNENKSDKEKIKPFYATLIEAKKGKDLSGTWIAGENKIEGLLNAINSADAALQKWSEDKGISLKKDGKGENEHLNITRTRFRDIMPKDPSRRDLMGMQASVSTDVVKNYTVAYVPKQSAIPNSMIPVQTTENKNEKVSVAGGTTVVETTTSTQQENAAPIITTEEEVEQQDSAIAEKISNNPNLSMTDILASLESTDTGEEKIRKILTGEQFTNSSIVTLEYFTDWCAENLPLSIVIENLGTLSNNLLRENVTAGYFVTALKTISVYRNSPFKYHEAFHAVFRLLLTDEKIAQLYALAAKEHPVTAEKLEKFREQYKEYAYLNDQDLAERYLEEYLADKFDAWMANRNVRTASAIKNFFNTLLEWVKNVLNRMSGRDIEALFYDINNGKYKNARIQDNQFSNNEVTASLPVPKLIKIGEIKTIGLDGKPVFIPQYLPQQLGEQLSSSITALFQQVRNNGEVQMSNGEILNNILDMYADTLNPYLSVYEERLKEIQDPLEKVKWVRKLRDRHKVFVDAESRIAVKEAVLEHLKIMGYKVQMEEDVLESQEARDGVRTTADYEKEADMFGGYSSLSKIIREYIGSTTMEVADEFGNTHFTTKDGVKIESQPMIQAVPAAHVYNGMLKTFANISDETQLMSRMLNYINEGRNPATIAFIQYVLKETGFTTDGAGNWIVPKNPILLEQVLKDFNKYETNPIFIELAFSQGIKAYNSNRQDSAKVQFDKWSDANQSQYMSQLNGLQNRKSIIDKAFAPLAELQAMMASANKDQQIDDDVLTDKVNTLSGQIKDNLGIDLHPSFIKFSIIATKSEEARTTNQNILYNAWVTISPITTDDITGIKSAMDTKVGNIFSTEFGATTRLIQMAAANAYFDETVDSMTYMGADGEMRYSSQFPNYNMIRVRQLNEQKIINELKASPDHNNFLLDNDSNFMKLSERGLLKTHNVDGLKVREAIPDEEQGDNRDVGYTAGNLEGSTGEGIAFKFMNDPEHQLFLISAYGAQNGKVQTGPKKSEYMYTTPIMISVVEAKNTANMVRMPVLETVSTVNNRTSITGSTLDKLYSFVEQEIEMIKRTSQEIENGIGSAVGYHTGKRKEDGSWEVAPRGIRLYNTKLWFSPELREKIEKNATDPNYIPTEEDKKEIKAAINSYLNKKIENYIQYLEKLGLITIEKGEVVKSLLPGFVMEGFKDPSTERDMKMNLIPGNFYHNISQIFLNDFLNTIALRQLLYGNEAKAFKDNIDRIKRMAGPNSSGRNVSFIFTAPELGINHTFTRFHHVTYKSTLFKKMNGTKPGDKDDAQMYSTAKGMRYALFGFGKLTKQQADIISKMERGEPVTEEEFFAAGGIKENKGATNSMKVVYFDNNNVYLKCSMIPLYRELTSIRVGNEWVAKPYMTTLHDLLNKMEEYEAGIRRDDRGYIIRDENGVPINHGETVVYAGPDTHSKGLKQNIAPSISGINNSHFEELDTKWFRLQMENPSNKTSVTDPTQNKQQILSEQIGNTEVWFDGKKEKVSVIMDTYMTDTAQRLTNNYQNAVNQMFSLDEGLIELDKAIELNQVTPSLANFFTIMKETLQATGANQQILDFLEVKDGEPLYDLNFPAILPKYTQIFFSYFSKVMAEKTPGITVALVSDAGIQRIKQVLEVFPEGHERAGQPKRWRVVTDAEYTRDPYKYRNARRWDDKENRTYVGLKKGDYIIDDLRHNYMKYDEKGNELGYFSEYMRPAHWKEEMGGVIKSLMYGFGIRIPSDDKHQYITLEMVDTLPVMYGSSAVFPQELIEISGADFDIDKLYIQLADTYIDKNGERVAYGTATTQKEKFEEFVGWQIENNKFVKNYISESLSQDEEVKELQKEYEDLRIGQKDLISDITDVVESLQSGVIDLSDRILLLDTPAWLYKYRKDQLSQFKIGAERATQIEEQIAVIKLIYALQAMREIGLPVSSQDFKDKGGAEKLNNGVLNNRILAAKIAMLNNEKISGGGKDAIINTATSTDPLVELVEELIEEFTGQDTEGAKAILSILEEEEIDINDLQGKSTVFINNKEGQRNIGAAINAMLVFSLAEQLGLSTADAGLYYNGEFHNNFSDSTTTDGQRKFAQISAIVNAMTDNAKERLAAKLGLNIQAVGMTTTMVALGIPLKDAVLHMLQPSVRKFFAAVRRSNSALNTGIKLSPKRILNGYLNAATKRLIKQYNLPIGEDGTPVYTPEVAEKLNLNEEKLIENISDNGTDSAYEFATLLNLQYIMELSDEFRNAASVMKLNQGMDTTWEDNDKTIDNINDLSGERKKMDFYTAFKSHPIFNTYLNIFEQVNQLAPKLFIERTGSFRTMIAMLVRNMTNIDSAFMTKTKNNVISYLSIKAYINWLKKNEYEAVLSTLNNALIYPSLQQKQGPDFKNISEIIRNLRESTDNYMVNEFLRYVEANDETNKGVINKAVSNIWAKLTENQQQRLYDSFIDLYNSPKTKMDAIALFNYLLVKDGGQFKTGSFIKYIPPFAFKDLLDRTKEITNMFANEQESDEMYMNIFGQSKEELFTDFLSGNGTHILNRKYIRTITPTAVMESDIDLDEKNKKNVDIEKVNMFIANPVEAIGDTINIDMFKNIRPSIIESRNQHGIVVDTKRSGELTDTEVELLKKNKLALERSGFVLTEGTINNKTLNQARFPFTIYKEVEVQDASGELTGEKYKVLYQLQSVGKVIGQGSATSLLGPGELVPTGVSAMYIKVNHTGSFETWEAQIATGEVPVTPKKSDAIINVDQARYSPSVSTLHDEKTDIKPFLVEVPVEKKPSEQISKQTAIPGVESIPNTGITIEQANSFIDIIKDQIASQAYKENTGKNANLMFNFGMSWGRKGDARFPNRGEAVKINSKAGLNGRYIYSKTDQVGKPLPSIKELQPIMDYIQSKLGIDMSAYDVVIGNLYEPGTFISQHSDIDESKSAENYPVIVINLGAGGPFLVGTDAGSKTINLENGGVYAFGINGENRWISHRTIDQFTSSNPLQPVVAAGRTIKDYRITLTFRRAADLEKGMPVTPKKLSTAQAPITQIAGSKLLNNIGDEIKLVYQAKYKQADLTYTISNIEETSNGYIVTLKGRTYNGTTKQTVTIENGKVVSSTRQYGGKDLPTDLSKASYNFRFAEQSTTQAPVTETTVQPGAYVKYNDGTFIVTKKNANGTWQIYDPTKEGVAAKKSVAEKNLIPTGTSGKIVTYKDQEYIVTPKQTIISLVTNKAMQWGEENGDRKAVLALAKGTQTDVTGTQMTREQWKEELGNLYRSKSTMSSVADIPQNKVSGIASYGSLVEANDAIKQALGSNPHSIDMIAAGFRTRTTRSEGEMDNYKIKVGDVIKHFGKSADGTTKTVYARVTAIHPKGSEGWKGTWEKEGWRAQDVNVIDRFKDGAAAIEFEVINPITVDERTWTMDKIAIRDARRRAGVPDATILEEIKAC